RSRATGTSGVLAASRDAARGRRSGVEVVAAWRAAGGGSAGVRLTAGIAALGELDRSIAAGRTRDQAASLGEGGARRQQRHVAREERRRERRGGRYRRTDRQRDVAPAARVDARRLYLR